MYSTGRRRIAWLLASTLVVACGGAAEKVEKPRTADTESDVDPDEFEITDEADSEIADEESEPAPAEKPDEEEQVAEDEEADPPPPPKAKPKKAKPKKEKKVVEREPERVAEADDEEEDESSSDEEKPLRERVNRQSMARYRNGDVAIGSGRNEREARMARDERLRAKKGRGSAREREEEAKEERAERAEEAREAKEARAEKARAAKEARAEKARKAKEAREAKAQKAKDAREAKARKAKEAKEARAEKARKANAREDEEEADADKEESEDEAPEKVSKKESDEDEASKESDDEDVIEMEGDEEESDDDEDSSTSIASIEEDDPLAEAEVDEAAPPPPVVIPMSINDRALTVAAKKLEVHGRLGLQTLTLPGATPGTTVSSTSESLALGVAYGIGKKAEVGADYTLSLNPGAIKGPLAFHVAYSAKHTAKLDFAISAGLAFDFIETANMATMTTSTTSFASLQLGAWARYRATPKVSIFTGLPALPSGAPSLSKQSLALPPFAYQLAIGLNNAGSTALEIPVGLGLQAQPNIYAFASFDLAHIRLANTQTALIFADFIPFTLGAFYTRNKLDIGVQLADDFKQGSDYLRLETVLRYSVK